MAAQYIFTIENLSKAYGKKDVLKNIWLSFYPGAKIGVIGGNGSGKSTLLRIMAGSETDYIGTARPAPGISIGYLSQEPMLDPSRDVRGNVEIAVEPIRAPSDTLRRDQYPACRWPRRRRDGRPARRASQGARRDRSRRGVGPRPPRRDRHGRHAAAPRRVGGEHAFRRRTQARGPLQDLARTARPPAAGRADQPPRRRKRRVA